MKISNIEKIDIKLILSLEKERIGNSLGEEELLSSLKEEGYICLTLKKGETLLGYILSSFSNEEAELYSIAIKKSDEGKGLGRQLMEALCKKLKQKGVKKLFLEVNKANERAKKLYENYGFTTYRVRKNYYNNNDALCMCKEI